jgi:hypothetical protein
VVAAAQGASVRLGRAVRGATVPASYARTARLAVGAYGAAADVTRRKQASHDETCGALGPDIRVSPQYLRPACCNRVRGHEHLPATDAELHMERKPDSFRVIASWTTPRDVPPNRRKIK